jgi:hypothetical protein
MTAISIRQWLPPDCARAAAEKGAATRYRPRHNRHGYDIDTLFWGALIFLALFVSCFLAWKAIERLRNRRKFEGAAGKAARTYQLQPEELVTLRYAPRKERKAMKERLKAREQARSAKIRDQRQ